MRTLRVVRTLVARGWAVTVLTGEPRTYQAGTPIDEALLERVPVDVEVLRARAVRPITTLKARIRGRNAPAPAGNGAVTRKSPAPRTGVLAWLARVKHAVDAAFSIPDREVAWMVPAIVKGLLWRLDGNRPDIVYSSSPPWTGTLVAGVLAGMLRRPWVADFRDPWSRAPWRGDRQRFAVKASALLERSVIQRAGRVVFVTQANRADFARFYGPDLSRRFTVVPNGCDPEEFEGLPQPQPDPHAPFVLLHAGSLYGGRSPIPLFQALAAALEAGVIQRGRFVLRFLGPLGLASVDIPGLLSSLNLTGMVEFVPRVPRRLSLEAMVSASALLLLQPGHAVSVPGKLYEYLAAGRPILAIAEEGETAELVRASGLGISVTGEDQEAMVTALQRLLDMVRSGTAPAPREQYDGNTRAEESVAILEDMARRRVTA